MTKNRWLAPANGINFRFASASAAKLISIELILNDRFIILIICTSRRRRRCWKGTKPLVNKQDIGAEIVSPLFEPPAMEDAGFGRLAFRNNVIIYPENFD